LIFIFSFKCVHVRIYKNKRADRNNCVYGTIANGLFPDVCIYIAEAIVMISNRNVTDGKMSGFPLF